MILTAETPAQEVPKIIQPRNHKAKVSVCAPFIAFRGCVKPTDVVPDDDVPSATSHGKASLSSYTALPQLIPQGIAADSLTTVAYNHVWRGFSRNESVTSQKRKRRSNLSLYQPKRRRLAMASKQMEQATDHTWRSLHHEDDTLRATTVWTPTRSSRDPTCIPREQGLRSTNSWTPTNARSETVCPSSDILADAPKKHTDKQVPPKSKKALFDNEPIEVLRKEISEILPVILRNLEASGKHIEFCQFLRLIAVDKFPPNNISFLLLLDVVKWYASNKTSQMKYTTETMTFWKTLYRLFHGKALRFMSGQKAPEPGTNEHRTAPAIDPQDTLINFAVPSINTLNNFKGIETGIPSEISPGIIDQGITLRSTDKQYVLSVDGKKLAPGLNKNHGDQDLFGHEEKDTLKMRNERIGSETASIYTLNNEWQKLSDDDRCQRLKDIIKLISIRIKDMRQLYLKQTFALKKFLKEAGQDWRTSKYVYAISSVQAMMYQILSAIKRLLLVNDKLLEIGSIIVSEEPLNRTYTTNTSIDMCAQLNNIRLKEKTDMPSTVFNENPRLFKQRSEEWFDLRKGYKVTGSTLFAALGLDTLKKQQQHYDRVVKGIEIIESVSDDLQKRFDHGTKSEIHATATLVSKVLPFYYPQLKFVEEGSHEIKTTNEEKFMLVSPDGSLCSIEANSELIPPPVIGCEFKCPFEPEWSTPVHYELPKRYISQVLAEMASMDVDELIYLCWSRESSTVFRVRFDADLWGMILQEMETVYQVDRSKRPTRLSNTSKMIARKLDEYRQHFTEFLCEVPSVMGQMSGAFQTNNESPYLFPITSLPDIEHSTPELEMTLREAAAATTEVHEICRKKATEVLVWLVSDTDRNWNPEVPHATPVAYAMPGYSLPVKPMRDMQEHVLQSCYDRGLNVVCCCFDGQWIKLANRDAKDKPLTLVQLQRDIFEKSSKVSRKDIVKTLKDTPILNNLDDVNIQFNENKTIMFVSSLKLDRLMKTLKMCSKAGSKHAEKHIDKETFDVDNFSSLPDDALETLITTEDPEYDVYQDPSAESSNEVVTTINEGEDANDRLANVGTDVSNETETNNNQKLSDSELAKVLIEFQKSEKKAILKRWSGKTVSDLKNCIDDVNKLKSLSHVELNSLIEISKAQQQLNGIIIKKTWTSIEKVNALSKVIGKTEQITVEKTLKHMKSLKDFAADIVQKNRKALPKQNLNSMYACMMHENSYKQWIDSSPFEEHIHLKDIGSTRIFSYPEKNETREKLEHRCIDYHHLFVNLRSKVCKDGLYGIRKDAWHRVADMDDTIISKSIVYDLIDKQNNAYAKRTFSSGVENAMRSLGYDSEADFCKLVRQWYQSEEMPGLSAQERCKRRLAFKDYLLHNVDFSVYPPPGKYIKGFPKVMFEGFVQRIDTTFQLYASVSCYNPRSISSLVNETFFGELSELEPTKLGCPKAISIPRLLSVVTEMQHFRCDPTKRKFKIITKRKSVYPATELQVVTPQNTSQACSMQNETMLMADLTVDDLDRINESLNADHIKMVLADIFHLDDHKTNLKTGIVMDMYYYTLQFARENKFTKEQISAFFSIVKKTHEVCIETPFGNLDQTFLYFKEMVLCHAVNRPPHSIELFTADQVRLVTEYTVNSFFRHIKMYKYAFTPLVRLDLSINYLGIPPTPVPSEADDGEGELTIEETTVDGADESPVAEKTPEPGESAARKELRGMIQTYLLEEIKKMKVSMDDQLKTTEELLNKKLDVAEGGGGKKSGRNSAKGAKKK